MLLSYIIGTLEKVAECLPVLEVTNTDFVVYTNKVNHLHIFVSKHSFRLLLYTLHTTGVICTST